MAAGPFCFEFRFWDSEFVCRADGCGALFAQGAQGCFFEVEDAQAALGLNACSAAIVDRSKYASCQLVSSGGAGDNVLPDPIKVGDIFVVDGRERTGIFFLGVEALCPGICSVYNCVIDLIEEHVDGRYALVEIRETDCRQAAIGHLLGRIVHIDANAADGERFAFVIACGLDQNAAELASSRDKVVGPFKANLVCKTLLFECFEHR